jgi:phosphoadenosine phosphosulfate reductase
MSQSDIEQIAIERIQFHRDRTRDKTYLAFSGGKDSVVIYDLAKKSGIQIEPHYHFTTVDPPELTRFIKSNYPEIQWDKPNKIGTRRGESPVTIKSMFQLIEWKHTPPTRRFRYCCEVLKEYGGRGRTVIDGVRWAESKRRSKRMMYERCSKNDNTFYLHPIIDWSDEDVWNYINLHNLKYCSLYDEGFKRIGCIMCPLTNSEQMIKEAKRWPKYYNAYLNAFRRMLISKPAHQKLQWLNEYDVMNWYIHGTKLSDSFWYGNVEYYEEENETTCEMFG